MEHIPLTEKQAKEANWPCDMCEHNFGSRTPEIKVCLPGQCQDENRRIRHLKPLNFKLEVRVLLISQIPGSGVSNTIKKIE